MVKLFKEMVFGRRATVPAVVMLCLCLPPLAARAQQDPPEMPADTAEAAADTAAAVQQPPPLRIDQDVDISIGYNLKVNVRLAPVYEDSLLTSTIQAYLARGSVVAVLRELDTWYQIEYGPSDNRTRGWVISYGVERTHEVEHVITEREEQQRWEGQKVQVVAGEAPIRSFPSSSGEVLVRAYRGEIFDIVGEAENYYMIQLNDQVRAWVWKGDVELYVKPRYEQEEVREMVRTSRQQNERITELEGLLRDLSQRRNTVQRDLADLGQYKQILDERLAEEERRRRKKPFFQFDSLKQNIAIRGALVRQAFAADMGLATSMFKGLGVSFKFAENMSLDLGYFTGAPTFSALGEDQTSLPASLQGLDTLTVDGTFTRFSLRYDVGNIGWLPLLGGWDNSLHAGAGHLSLEATAAGEQSSQDMWGALLGWHFSKGLFGSISFEAGLEFFLTSTEVTDVRFPGEGLLYREDKFLVNQALYLGAKWQF